MQKDKAKLKNDFKRRPYRFMLRLVEFLDKLPNDNVSRSIATNYCPAGQV